MTAEEPAIRVVVEVNGNPLEMEVDSGAVCSVINERTMRQLRLSKHKLQPCELRLRTYNQQELKVLGSVMVQVTYKGRQKRLRLVVIKGAGVGLLGRDWFKALGIELRVNQLEEATNNQSPSSAAVLSRHADVFQPGLGKSKGPPVRVEVEPTAQPKFFKPRPVPFALLPKVDEALDKLIRQGILEPVRHSSWATPIVPVVKKDGTVRICGDYKSTVNPVVRWESYPLPTPEELFAKLAGCARFSKLDLDQAYLQLTVDSETADLLTITTHRGLFRVTRLQFGVAVAVAIFQRYMEELLQGLEGVQVFLDDILVGGKDEAEHNTRLQAVLQRIQDDGVRLKRDKCVFGVDEVVFLGYKVSKAGIQPTDDKVKAIHGAQEPKCKKELQAFLGALNFYNRFLRGAAHTLEPLYRLLDNGHKWRWTTQEAEAFLRAKQLLQSSDVLAHYSVHQPLVMACDASPYGLGVVLSHVDSERREVPVAYGSRTMTAAERNYAQTDREALAIGFGIRKFHKFIYGRHFRIVTDHKPLLGLLHHAKPMPQVLSPRMLRWSLMLSAYDYELEYRPAHQLRNADALSRLPLTVEDSSTDEKLFEVRMLETAPEIPWDAQKIARCTRNDPTLSRVRHWTGVGWPQGRLPDEFKPFVRRQHELLEYRGCLLWGCRVIIPEQARDQVLELLHTTHPGIVRMKALARSTVWWPGINQDIERKVRTCLPCQETRPQPARARLHPWEFARNPWSRIHIDFAGPFQGKVFLLVVDAHSKWLEVIQIASMSSAAVCQRLRVLFATHGVPDTIVSDNGTAFVSQEFEEFLQRNQIRHVKVAPYHPSSNGQVERMVQETKQVLRRMEGGDMATKLARFLLSQHILPHSTTGKSPAELLMGRRLRTALDRLHPDLQAEMVDKQEEQALRGRQGVREFEPREPVFIRNYLAGPKWLPGIITEITGPVSYKVRTIDGRFWKRHVDQIRRREWSTYLDEEEPTTELSPQPLSLPSEPSLRNESVEECPPSTSQVDFPEESTPVATPPASPQRSPASPHEPRHQTVLPTSAPAQEQSIRPQRQRRRPDYLKDYVT
ncbi:uncharacterized protein K02A2.6-like [Ixodes scapularis]|uniref:uncharacterized protein K02A2.6-like n=1 Tax=Ixodes scapularis TaxID=6945 RepID=UPI001C37F9F2|nr:uncharacterized protein K02A2.6-like [Ixodes scapularis]